MRDVLRSGAVVHDRLGEAKDGVSVSLVQRAEGIVIALPNPQRKGNILGR